jgi:catechol 2,3-dioxygenase-like lactoylglutathione lyase family enzyme
VFDHVTIRVDDRAASEEFYDTVLAPLGVEKTYRTQAFSEWRDFSLAAAERAQPATRGLHVGFVAPSQEQVDAFWQAGVDAGYTSDGEPGPRTQYRDDYYGAFLRDPDGNSAEAVLHGALRRGGVIDHLWIRVADIDASKRFYATIAPMAGLHLRRDEPERAQFAWADGAGSFTLVADAPPSQNVHMAFPTGDDTDVDVFHRAATKAGYRSNGPPAERPQYHPGYYAAYVLDPDGNNIEIVNHHR